MKKFNLIISGFNYLDPTILINDKKVKFTKNMYKNKVYSIETEEDIVDIKMETYHDEEYPGFILMSIIFYIISFFGMFDLKYKAKPMSIKYHGKFKLVEEETNLRAIFNQIKPELRAIKFEGNCEIDDNESNNYFVNEEIIKIQKKLKRLKKIVFVLTVLVIIGIVLLVK